MRLLSSTRRLVPDERGKNVDVIVEAGAFLLEVVGFAVKHVRQMPWLVEFRGLSFCLVYSCSHVFPGSYSSAAANVRSIRGFGGACSVGRWCRMYPVPIDPCLFQSLASESRFYKDFPRSFCFGVPCPLFPRLHAACRPFFCLCCLYVARGGRFVLLGRWFAGASKRTGVCNHGGRVFCC